MDCDLYASAKYVLDTLADLIVKGTVIEFDELYNYEAYKDHEWKALHEFCLENNK